MYLPTRHGPRTSSMACKSHLRPTRRDRQGHSVARHSSPADDECKGQRAPSLRKSWCSPRLPAPALQRCPRPTLSFSALERAPPTAEALGKATAPPPPAPAPRSLLDANLSFPHHRIHSARPEASLLHCKLTSCTLVSSSCVYGVGSDAREKAERRPAGKGCCFYSILGWVPEPCTCTVLSSANNGSGQRRNMSPCTQPLSLASIKARRHVLEMSEALAGNAPAVPNAQSPSSRMPCCNAACTKRLLANSGVPHPE